MDRIFVVASSEFQTLVKTKAFLISLLAMPLFYGVAIGFQVFAAKRVDAEVRRFAVIDHSGVLYSEIEKDTATFNAKAGTPDAPTGPRFESERIDLGTQSIDAIRMQLSDRVRAKELFAFIEVPVELLNADAAGKAEIKYYSETPSYARLPDWIEKSLNDAALEKRLAGASIDPALVGRLNVKSELTVLGLAERDATGKAKDAKQIDKFAAMGAPMIYMFLMFLAVMSTAPNLLNAVIEEKMTRISEVLVASITPFQLMMGKLLGVAAVSLLLGGIYFFGVSYAAVSFGYVDLIKPSLVIWFVIFLISAVLIFGSVFVAIGSACSDIKDAQSMMMPAMLLLMAPFFAWTVVLNAPNSSLATGLSLFPTAAPFLMMLRLALPPGPPMWQLVACVVILAASIFFIIWAAARIFRVGVLMQGKGATFREMIKWIRAS
jgi:ABC-2 type transport system permease protein